MTAQPATRRIEHVTPDPGPMPPRWFGSAEGTDYEHETLTAHVTVGRSGVPSWEGEGDETVAADLLDLLRWLKRGGR